MQEITTVGDVLREYASHTRRWIILMLHSALAVEEQVWGRMGEGNGHGGWGGMVLGGGDVSRVAGF